jgi:hypothetical protein
MTREVDNGGLQDLPLRVQQLKFAVPVWHLRSVTVASGTGVVVTASPDVAGDFGSSAAWIATSGASSSAATIVRVFLMVVRKMVM